jgi:two-component system repressor protein LuxO
MAQYCEEEGKNFTGLAPDAEEALLRQTWPGNVRELQNVLRRAIVFNEGPLSTAAMLDLANLAAPPATPEAADPSGRELWQIERDVIEGTIATCGGSIPKAAKLLGVSPSTIYRKREAWMDARPLTG